MSKNSSYSKRESILSLFSPETTLERVGGKGANLALLARAGYPVPSAFLITVEAYRAYVIANDLRHPILTKVSAIQGDNPEELNAVSTAIQGWFAAGVIPAQVAEEVRTAYRTLGSPPVAVRSSATGEDLPGLSFAGQQDTFLNVIGEESLLAAVVKCWSSLWTARAIGYRAHNRVPSEEIALAVIVQTMVNSEVSGVLFTANPLTGLRTEISIEATLGLGEALVSGKVEPDRYIVEGSTGKILSKSLGAKAITIRGKAGGGLITLREDAGRRQALPDEQIVALAALGQRVAAEYNFPQDIEWAWAGGNLYLLQSRPITSLYPLPEGVSPEPLRVMFSFGAVQGMLDPITPLGQDAVRLLLSGGARMMGYHLNYASQPILRPAGERIWIDITPVLRNRRGRKYVRGALRFVEPTVGQAAESLWNDPRLMPQSRGLPLGVVAQVLPRILPIAVRVFRHFLNPEVRRLKAIEETDRFLAHLRNRCAVAGDRQARLLQRVALLRRLMDAFPRAIPALATGIMAGMICFNRLLRLVRRWLPRLTGDDPARLVLELTRSLRHNVTTEMDLQLWETAQGIRSDAAATIRFQKTSAARLAADYQEAKLPVSAQSALTSFLNRYGMRGIGEIDLGHPRWRDDPTSLMQALQSYLKIENPDQAPDVVFHHGEEAAIKALSQLEAAVRRVRGGVLKARVIRVLARRMRALLGLRESPKFFIIRMMGLLREGLLESGRELVEGGLLKRADDLFFLHLPELEELAQGIPRDWRGLISERRAAYEREKLRQQIPRVLLSDGRAIYGGLTGTEADRDVLVGSPVSPGVVEGIAHVVLDPRNAELAPGEILVCPATDPAWTPLFLAAGGLVMEVGGLMTHGSVVAREYGIPAVVGVDRATQRLKTGQRIRVDGSSGRIQIIG